MALRPVVVGVTALVLTAVGALSAAPASAALGVHLVNKSGRPDSRVYVMLDGGSSSGGRLQNDQPVRLSEIHGRRFGVRQMSGRIYLSFGAPVAPNEPNDSPIRYDKVELTYPGVANLTAVDFFGIPMSLRTIDGQGNTLGTLGYKADATRVERSLLWIPGAKNAVVRTAGGGIARILSPQLSPSSYPDLRRYVESMAGRRVVVRGAFYGTPFETFAYAGRFGPQGSITLRGTITPQGGEPAAGRPLTVGGRSLAPAVYTVNGPYVWGNQVHHVGDNDVYAVIYRDLLSGFAWGYWGGRYGDDSARWQGKPPFAAARVKPSPFATYNRYAAVIYRYSNAYGFSFSDTGPKSVVLGLDDAATLRVVIPPE